MSMYLSSFDGQIVQLLIWETEYECGGSMTDLITGKQESFVHLMGVTKASGQWVLSKSWEGPLFAIRSFPEHKRARDFGEQKVRTICLLETVF